MTEREALKLALEALKDAGKDDFWRYQDKAITAIKEALAQPEQEPVAWRIRCTDPMRDWVLMYRYPKTEEQFSNMEIQSLYTIPPQSWEKFCDSNCVWTDHHPDCKLAEQKPVALETVYETIIQWDEGGGKRSRRELARRIVSLYTTPPQRKPLTDEEIKAVCAETWSYDPYVIARAIEAAHGIKENT